MPHYWSGYTAEMSQKEQHPRSLVQYIRTAQTEVGNGGDCLATSRKAGRLKRKMRTHHAIVEGLMADTSALEVYRRVLKRVLVDRMPLAEKSWGALQAELLAIASVHL